MSIKKKEMSISSTSIPEEKSVAKLMSAQHLQDRNIYFANLLANYYCLNCLTFV